MVVGCVGLLSFAKRSADSIGDGALKESGRPQFAGAAKTIFNIFFFSRPFLLAAAREGATCQLFGFEHVQNECMKTMVLIVQSRFLEWYLLWRRVSARGTYYALQFLQMVLIMARSVKRWYLIAMLSSSK